MLFERQPFHPRPYRCVAIHGLAASAHSANGGRASHKYDRFFRFALGAFRSPGGRAHGRQHGERPVVAAAAVPRAWEDFAGTRAHGGGDGGTKTTMNTINALRFCRYFT